MSPCSQPPEDVLGSGGKASYILNSTLDGSSSASSRLSHFNLGKIAHDIGGRLVPQKLSQLCARNNNRYTWRKSNPDTSVTQHVHSTTAKCHWSQLWHLQWYVSCERQAFVIGHDRVSNWQTWIYKKELKVVARIAHHTPYVISCNGKGKAVPLKVWSDPEGCRKLKSPDFMTTAQDGGKIVSPTHRLPLPPGNVPGTHFC